MFTMRVGNLMPGERADVHLALVGPVAIEEGDATFRFPLVVAPRYVPGVPPPGEDAGDERRWAIAPKYPASVLEIANPIESRR